MTRRTLDDIIANADKLADTFENYEPTPEDGERELPPVMSVKLAAWRRDLAERDLAEAVQSARRNKVSWRELGNVIGTSGEAVRQRYGAA
ncbi:hypothetical protein [Candidatus Corynebacterium faecigallinarum]|uniref:hypothetical protein n=1 Tax=Candidatus Corynebacterium faecigallinarum TaxID=2838528 RepID=UPI003FCF0BB7